MLTSRPRLFPTYCRRRVPTTCSLRPMPTEEGRLLPAGGKASRADKIYRPPSLPNAVLISRRAYKFAKVRAIFCTANVGKKTIFWLLKYTPNGRLDGCSKKVYFRYSVRFRPRDDDDGSCCVINFVLTRHY